jgi:phosphomannomutase / phosphoglucomutase
MMMTQLFGTNGIRGIVNKDMTSDFALQIGKAWGTFLKTKKRKPSVVIGTDARLSNNMLKESVTAGFLATGCNITDIGLVPTPSLQFTVKEKQFDSGVMITASHNPPEFNGIKGIDTDGTEFSKETEEQIERIYFNKDFQLASWDTVGMLRTWDGANNLYLKGILSTVDVALIKNHGFHVVLDCGSGAGSMVTPLLLKELGCKMTGLYCEPDGHFPGHPSEPIPENVSELIRTVKETDADLGIVQDGDADRAIFIDENGTYIWGDQTLSLFADYLTKQKQKSLVVTPVTSSTSLDDVVKKNGGMVIHTRVGSPIVARVMREKNAVFGGEENGGLIFPQLQYCRDSAMTLAKMLELLASTKKSLSELISDIPSYCVVKKKVPCGNTIKQLVLESIQHMAEKDTSPLQIDRTDGLKLYYPSGWVLIRPSGTEPLVRIYAESENKQDAEELASSFFRMVTNNIKKLEGS